MNNNKIIEAFNLNGTKAEEFLKEKIDNLFPEKIKISDCIKNVENFIKGEIDENEYENQLNKIGVRIYLPIINKMTIIMELINSMNISRSIMDGEAVIIELYKNIFYKVILEGYGQIDLLEKDYLTYENYDLLYPTYGIYIKSFCKEDLNNFMDMLRDVLSFNGIFNLNEKIKNINEDEIKNSTKEIEKMLNGLKDNEKLINNLSTIISYNDPIYNKVKKEMLKEAKEDIKNIN